MRSIVVAIFLVVGCGLGSLAGCGSEQTTPSVDAGADQSAAGCVKDTDCKGDRVCEAGACVAPQSLDASTGCVKDADCKGNRICIAAMCVDRPPDGAVVDLLGPHDLAQDMSLRIYDLAGADIASPQ